MAVFALTPFLLFFSTHTQTHTHTYIYVYIIYIPQARVLFFPGLISVAEVNE